MATSYDLVIEGKPYRGRQETTPSPANEGSVDQTTSTHGMHPTTPEAFSRGNTVVHRTGKWQSAKLAFIVVWIGTQ
jgi:hypothetical protein